MVGDMDKKEYSVLLIEDSSMICNAITKILNTCTKNSFKIKIASTITEGASVLSETSPNFDLAITSLYLPDSYGLLSIMAILEVTSDVPIIALSDVGEDWREDAIAYGAADCIEKIKVELDEKLHISIKEILK